MALLIDRLRDPPALDGLTLESLAEAHREPLRAACAEDAAIWEVYPSNWTGADFDRNFDAERAEPAFIAFAIVEGLRLIGETAYIRPDPVQATAEIGATYIRPALRGTGLNDRLKRLMIDHAFACGVERIEFRVDTRNLRSQAAVAKIGGVLKEVLRKDRTTWTGYVRDTAVLSIVKGEWR